MYKNFEMIQPLAKDYSTFWLWPPGGQAMNQIRPKFGL
jgi:hypothetical protein